MHWEKMPPSGPGRSRPYQGVRVRDPVKELLRRKRSLEPRGAKAAASATDVAAQSSQPAFTAAMFGSDAPAAPAEPMSDGGLQCSGWKASAAGAASQAAGPLWSSTDYNQQDSTAPTLGYQAAPALTADVYMQTLCPSYTMLTYTHTPLLTNFGTIPVAPAQTSVPQMELSDSGLTYLPWAQPLTTLSSMSNPGVQFASSSAALPGSPLVPMPLSMSLATMIPQLGAQGGDPHSQILELPLNSDHQLDPEQQGQSLTESPEDAPESPNLLDKLLEDHKKQEEQDKDSYSSSLFIANV
ncbi:POU domain class 2-associating factor 1 isoform X1 [Oryzias latipes]|uniref:OCA domain-containing protein n=1 Tax=Oryzias latipes TaxID=8090 RepID=A0A3B3HEY1_ORYLA|nr:POU domain class 2-associating factor 1 isoform X1 [Oryzias latipes]